MNRLLIVVDRWFEDSPGGMARVAADHAGLLTREGWQVTVAAIATAPDLAGMADVRGIRLVRLPVDPRLSGLRRLRAFRRGLQDSLGHEIWDLVHLHSAPLGAAALRVLSDDVPVITTIHSPLFDEVSINWRDLSALSPRRLLGIRLLSRLERRVLKRSAAVHVLSEFTRSRLRDLHGPIRTTLIPHWISDERFKEVSSSSVRGRQMLGWPETSPILFTIRGHKPRVGLEDLIAAAAPSLRAGLCHLVIAGSGPLTSKLTEVAADCGVEDSVLFPGRISDSNLWLSYREADLFVLPSRALECFGMVTIEALACGLPVVASNAGATPEILGDLMSRFLYEAGDVAALRNRLESFLAGGLAPPSPMTLAEFVGKRYSESAVAPRFLALVRNPKAQG